MSNAGWAIIVTVVAGVVAFYSLWQGERQQRRQLQVEDRQLDRQAKHL